MTLLRRLSWLWILILGVGPFEAVRHALIDTGNPTLLPALILLAATTHRMHSRALSDGRLQQRRAGRLAIS